jgi:conjugative transfer signal peptidase TraF
MRSTCVRWTPTGMRKHGSTLVLGLTVLLCVGSTRWIRLNVSPSVPLGLYRLVRLAPPLARGTLVLFPVPAVMRPWWGTWWIPFLKPVAAIAGDEVCVHDKTLWIAGLSYGLVYDDAEGQVLPHVKGCQAVPEGTVFVASREPKSIDSRYYGPLPLSALSAVATPLWVWQ